MAATSAGFRRQISALDEVFEFVADFVGHTGIDDRTAYCISLVAEELFTNMIRHNRGGGACIDLHLEREGDRVRLELTDTDVDRFDPTTVGEVPVSAGLDERQPGGLGLHLVRSMVDQLEYDYHEESRSMRIVVSKVLGR